MSYGIGSLNNAPVRRVHEDRSEMITELLFGDAFKILESWNQWRKIQFLDDHYEGWVDAKQIKHLTEKEAKEYREAEDVFLSDLVGYVSDEQQALMALSAGANLKAVPFLGLYYDNQIETKAKKLSRAELVETALLYLNAPYLWGGKTPFGIDCSGLTQMIYRIGGYSLFRDAHQQATQGKVLSFMEESQPGDLAFFDNDEGRIIHVGILLGDHYILHAHGKVRMDRIDPTGIFNPETRRYSHQLRLIRQILPIE